MTEFIPISTKGIFYSSFYHWYQHEGFKDVHEAIRLATKEAGITPEQAHELCVEIKARSTAGLAETGSDVISAFFRVNRKTITSAAKELAESA